VLLYSNTPGKGGRADHPWGKFQDVGTGKPLEERKIAELMQILKLGNAGRRAYWGSSDGFPLRLRGRLDRLKQVYLTTLPKRGGKKFHRTLRGLCGVESVGIIRGTELEDQPGKKNRQT